MHVENCKHPLTYIFYTFIYLITVYSKERKSFCQSTSMLVCLFISVFYNSYTTKREMITIKNKSSYVQMESKLLHSTRYCIQALHVVVEMKGNELYWKSKVVLWAINAILDSMLQGTSNLALKETRVITVNEGL